MEKNKRKQGVILYEKPSVNVSDDMTIQEYIHNSTEYAVNINFYIDELINQIINKVPFIDLREKKEKE